MYSIIKRIESLINIYFADPLQLVSLIEAIVYIHVIL